VTAEEVLAAAQQRGLAVALSPDGRLLLKGPGGEKTPALIGLLKAHREGILAFLSAPPLGPEPPAAPAAPLERYCERLRDWLYRGGAVHREERWCKGAVEPADGGGAWWWRYQGETGWRPVPGRLGTAADLPPGETMAEG